MARASASPIESSWPRPSAAQRAYAAAAWTYLFVTPFPSSAGLRAVALFVALAALAYELWKGRAAWASPPRALTLFGLGWIAWCCASLAWSERPAYSFEELQRELGYASLAFVAFFAGARGEEDLRRAVKALLAGALLLGLFEWIAILVPTLSLSERYIAVAGSSSTQVVLVAPLILLLAARGPLGLGARPWVVGAVGVGLVLAGLATGNRMLWIALLSQVACVAYASRRSARPAAARARKAAAVALALIALALVGTWLYKADRYYPEAPNAVESLEFDQRPAIWSAAIAMIAERPWRGHGFGREIVGDRIEAAVPSRASDVRLRHGHNMFLDVLLQAGIIGLALFAAVLVALLRAFAGAAKRPEIAPLATVGVAMVVGFVVKNLTDDFDFRPASLVFWALCGLLLGISSRRGSER